MDNHYTQKNKILRSIPYPMRVLVGFLAYLQIKATVWSRNWTIQLRGDNCIPRGDIAKSQWASGIFKENQIRCRSR